MECLFLLASASKKLPNEKEEMQNHIALFGNGASDNHSKLLPIGLHQYKEKDL